MLRDVRIGSIWPTLLNVGFYDSIHTASAIRWCVCEPPATHSRLLPRCAQNDWLLIYVVATSGVRRLKSPFYWYFSCHVDLSFTTSFTLMYFLFVFFASLVTLTARKVKFGNEKTYMRRILCLSWQKSQTTKDPTKSHLIMNKIRFWGT